MCPEAHHHHLFGSGNMAHNIHTYTKYIRWTVIRITNSHMAPAVEYEIQACLDTYTKHERKQHDYCATEYQSYIWIRIYNMHPY